jgi:hypothetical protein
MMDWFLIVMSVATYSNMQGCYIGPLTEESCKAAEHALHDSPSHIDARCKRSIALRICPVPDHPEISFACPVFEGEGFVPSSAIKREEMPQ